MITLNLQHAVLAKATPPEIDADLFLLLQEEYRARDARSAALLELHTLEDAKQYSNRYYSSAWSWGLSDAEVVAKVERVLAEHTATGRGHQIRSESYQRYQDAVQALADVKAAREPFAAEFARRGGWTRAYLVDNADGHLHKSDHCPTLHKGNFMTRLFWITEVSGQDEAQIVEAAGEKACDVCYENYGGGIRLLKRRCKTLEELVKGRYVFDEATGCWIWQGKPKDTGYGQIKVGGRDGRVVNAHQAIYELMIGPVPEGLELDHLCRNRLCVNPEHLEPVTHAVNVRRGASPAALAAKATNCPKGHPYNAENTYWRPDGAGRGCRTCNGWTGGGFSHFEGPNMKAAREEREARAAEKAARDATKAEKAITNPDGSVLRGKYGPINTVVSAWRELVDIIVSHRLYNYDRYPQTEQRIVAALAAKTGQSEDVILAEVEKKVAAKIKRESR